MLYIYRVWQSRYFMCIHFLILLENKFEDSLMFRNNSSVAEENNTKEYFY